MAHGSRQHCCTNHPGFRKESARISRALALHFAKNPHVIGWQTDNEFYCHMSECHCQACAAAFQGWLKQKYRSIGALNAAWGCAFWAQTYDRFADIPLPRPTSPSFPNPGHQLDYYRFLSDGIRGFQSEQVAILRRSNKTWWISHNGVFDHIDHWTFAADLDFYGVDVYPGFSGKPDPDPVWTALKNEDCRAASGNFVVFEQQGGAGGQLPYLLPTPRPDQMRLWAWQAVAHGADGILHFRWRTCRFGAEIYWNGILDQDNIPRRRYEEFAREGEEFHRISPHLAGTVPVIEAAVLVQRDQDEAHRTMPMGLPSPGDQRKHLYRELQRRHLPCGLVDASDSFAGLQVIFLPGFTLMDEDLASRLCAFVERGGTLVASARTATRDRFNRVLAFTPPGWLGELFGITVEEFGAHDPLTFACGKSSAPAGSAYEILAPLKRGGAKILSRWNPLPDRSPHAAPGTAAFTHRKAGRGNAFYAGTFFSAENTGDLVSEVLKRTGLVPLAEAPAAVEITCRAANRRRLTFALNHSGAAQTVRMPASGTELITGKPVRTQLRLAPYGVAVVESAPRP
jgi:beta-galactosidase